MTVSGLLARPDFHTAPTYTQTLGPEVADLCEQVGYAPYPEQRLILDDLFALDPVTPNKSAAFEAAVVCARQNMKTGAIKQAALGWLFITDQPLIVWSAHEFNTASESHRDLAAIIEGSDMLRRRVRRIYSGNGAESVELLNGNRLIFKARTGGGGRGLTGNKVILDEAFALKPEHMGALLPTLLSVPDPQVVYGSSAGLLGSDILRAIRDRGRAGSERLAYAEWCSQERECAEDDGCPHLPGHPGCALDDRELWAQANPIHARRDPSMTAVAALRNALPPAEFARECLGWWEDPPTLGADDFLSGWDDASSTREPAGQLSLGLDVSHDLRSAALAVCGGGVLEVVDYRRGAGTGWVPDRVRALREKHRIESFGIVAGSPAASLLPKLPDDTTALSGSEAMSACAAFAQDINEGRLAHRSQASLDIAVGSAVRVMTGEGSRWSRRKSPVDISPLWSAAIAAYLGSVAPPPADPGVYLI